MNTVKYRRFIFCIEAMINNRTSVNSLTRRPALLIGIILASLASEDLRAAATLQSSDSIRTAVTDFVRHKSRLPHSQAEVDMVIGSIDPRLQLAACTKSLSAFLPAGSRLSGNSTVGVRCDGAQPWSLYVPVRIKVLAVVWVSTRALGRGEIIKETDIQSQTHDLAAIPSPVITDLAGVLGRQTIAPIAPGTILHTNLLRASRVVRRGEKVTILASTAGIEVKMTGEALSDGSDGDSIQVRNILTKKIIQATVIEAGTVRVRL